MYQTKLNTAEGNDSAEDVSQNSDSVGVMMGEVYDEISLFLNQGDNKLENETFIEIAQKIKELYALANKKLLSLVDSNVPDEYIQPIIQEISDVFPQYVFDHFLWNQSINFEHKIGKILSDIERFALDYISMLNILNNFPYEVSINKFDISSYFQTYNRVCKFNVDDQSYLPDLPKFVTNQAVIGIAIREVVRIILKLSSSEMHEISIHRAVSDPDRLLIVFDILAAKENNALTLEDEDSSRVLSLVNEMEGIELMSGNWGYIENQEDAEHKIILGLDMHPQA